MSNVIDSNMPKPVLVTVSELARRNGVTKQSMHERVRRLAEKHEGLVQKHGRNVMVDVAMFETALTENGDAVKEAGQSTRRLMNDDSDSDGSLPRENHYRDAQTERARIDARIKAIELAKLQNQLVPIDGPNGIHAAMRGVADIVTRRVDLIPRVAQKLHDEGLISDQSAVRRLLRNEIDDVMRKIATDMRTLSLEAENRNVTIDIDGEDVAQ